VSGTASSKEAGDRAPCAPDHAWALGFAHENGNLLPQGEQEAGKWYQIGANLGDLLSQEWLRKRGKIPPGPVSTRGPS
jgi:hypothetical protein